MRPSGSSDDGPDVSSPCRCSGTVRDQHIELIGRSSAAEAQKREADQLVAAEIGDADVTAAEHQVEKLAVDSRHVAGEAEQLLATGEPCP